jgi:hypothetical protein
LTNEQIKDRALAYPKNLPIGALSTTAMDGEDIHNLPLSMRKTNLKRRDP